MLRENLERFTVVLETTLTGLLAIGIAVGIFDIFRYFFEIYNAPMQLSYEVFKAFLAHTLLLVVGIELMMMLLSHSTNAILELVLFVIARKMLIYGETMLDMVFGMVAIAGVFAILKFLAPRRDFVARHDRIFSASAFVERVIRDTGLELPTNKGRTLGGLVSHLAKEANVSIANGVEFRSDALCIKVVKVNNGVIERVMITEIGEDCPQ